MEMIKLLLYNNNNNNNIIIIIIIVLMQLLNFIPNVDCNQTLATTAITTPKTTIKTITTPKTTKTITPTTTKIPTETTTNKNTNQSTPEPELPEDDKIIKFISYPTKIEIKIINDTYELIERTCDNGDFRKTKLLLILVDKNNNNNNNNNNNSICDNLQPCKRYSITAVVKNKFDNKTRTISKSLQTEYARPEITIDTIIPYKDSIHITWNTTNSECIFNYTINGKSDDFTTSYVCNNPCNEATLKDLHSCQNYSIEMISYDVNDRKIFHGKNSTETDETDPGPVKSIKFDLQPNNSTIKVKWEPPEYKYCIHFYDLKWALLNDLNINDSKKLLWNHYNFTDTKTNEFIIKNLTGCEEYIFQITVNGEEINNSLNLTFNSSIQVSGPVKDLKIQSKFSTNITIEWKPPEHHMKCIKEYKLELFGPYEIHKIYEISETHIILNDLKPCGEYNLTIKPIMINEIEGQQSDIGFTMEHDKPSIVLNITADSYPKEILVEWKIPKFSELCIQNYRIEAWYDNDENGIEHAFSNTTEETKITIKSLKSCTLYSIQIIATTGIYDGIPGLIKSKTIPTQSAPPDNIEVKLATHNSLELRARDTDPTNNCQILSVRFSCKTDDDVKIKFGETIVDVKGAIGLFSGTVKPLSPNAKYNCRVAIFNIAGWSVNNEAVCETGKYYPDKPDSIYINHTTLSSIHILWKPPKYPNGNIIMYKLHIQTLRPLYKVPINCPNIESIKKTIEVSKTESLFQDGIIPFVEYGIQVAVMNDFGVSEFSEMIRVSTKAAEPTPIEYFEAVEINGPSLNENMYEASALLKWDLPCRTNGKIKYFQLDFTGTHRNRSEIFFIRIYPNKNDPSINDYEHFEWNETKLMSDYNYVVYIKMYLEEGYESITSTTRFSSPAGIPRKLNITGKGIVNAFLAKNPTSSALAKISNDIFTLNAENILYAALLVSEKSCQNDPDLEFGVIESKYYWPNVSNWFQVQLEQECIRQYQTTPIRWVPLTDGIDGYYLSRSDENRYYTPYTIGIEKNCNDRPNDYCNGPLKPGTSYSVVLRLFTRSGYNDVAQLSFYTDTEVRLLLVILLVVICLLLAFFSGIIYLWISRRMKWHRESINGMANINRDVNEKNFLLHYAEISKRDKIMREFKELSTLTNDLDLSINASKSNESKNRYSNIYPYDRNRVILDSDSEGSDYINASFINGYKKKKEYIATQGPKPDCFIDFWRMILQYNVRIIVMLTEMKEGETVKCHQYFPLHSSDIFKFGHNITITCKKGINHDSIYERRELLVKHSGYGLQQNIIHYFFKKWPDHDCPNDPTELIHFIRKIKSEKIPKRSPIVVHCSAGCGRTGTLIGLDIIMQRLKSENSINIFETVKELRYQRIKMVQTIQQYQFLYKCAFQLVKKNFSPTNKFSNSHSNSSNNMHISNSSISLNSGSNNVIAAGGIGSHILTNNISDEQLSPSRLNKSTSNISLNGRRNSRQYQQQQQQQIHQSKSFLSNEIETSM